MESSTRNIREFADAVLHAVKRRMFGVDDVVRLSLVALYTDGHVLLEGNPGFGKTELVKTLGKVLKLPRGRIQFTPDLMPTDITGTYMPDLEDRTSTEWEFREGPIFTSLLLADEVNRATPKTQSAMLEAMAERQVTVLGKRQELDMPFMVLATQNPIDHEGTYNLPEAQADRFMFKITMPVPDGDTLDRIIDKQAGVFPEEAGDKDTETRSNIPLLPKDKEQSREMYVTLCQRIQRVGRLPAMKKHIRNMFLASNWRFKEMEGCKDARKAKQAKRLVKELLTYGLGPRAAIALTMGAQAWWLLFERDPKVTQADGFALARVAIPTLRHRIKLDLDWEDRYHEITKTHPTIITYDAATQASRGNVGLLERVLADFCYSMAPETHGYHSTVKQALNQVFEERGW